MKKLVVIFLSLLTTGLLISSCQKCVVCTHVDQTTGLEVPEEFCDKKGSVVQDFEDQFLNDWDTIGGYCERN